MFPTTYFVKNKRELDPEVSETRNGKRKKKWTERNKKASQREEDAFLNS